MRTRFIYASLFTTLSAPLMAVAATAQTAPEPMSDADTAAASEIVVTGSSDKYIAGGALGGRAILNTPFSVSTVSGEDIQNRLVSNIGDVLKADASVRSSSNSTGGVISLISVRGLMLDQQNGYKMDGLAFPNRTDLPMEAFDQVQLLKGASGFMYGFGAPGGIVNFIMKKPTDDRFLTLGAGWASDNVWKANADTGGRIANGLIGYRLNGTTETGDTYVDGGRIHRYSVSGAVDVKPTENLTLYANGLYSDRTTDGVMFGVYLPDSTADYVPTPKAISGRTRLAEDDSYYKSGTTIATAGANWQIAPHWSANVTYRYASENTSFREGNAYVLNAAGDYSYLEFTRIFDYRYNQVQGIVAGRFETGPITHDLVIGGAWQRFEQINDKDAVSSTLGGAISNIYNPTGLPASGTSNAGHRLYKAVIVDQTSAFISDTMTLGKFSLVAGERYTDYSNTNYDEIGGRTSKYGKKPFTPTVAILFKPRPDTTLYGSFVRSLEQGGVASVTNANYGTVYGPLKSSQYEIGAKTDRALWGASIAAFRVNRGANYTNTANVFVQDGVERYQGIEASASIRPVAGLNLKAQGIYLDAKYREGDGDVVGNRVAGTSKYQASFQADYDVPIVEGLKLIGNVNYIGSTKLQASNMNTVPGYTTADIAAALHTKLGGTPVLISAALQNIANKHYWLVYQGDSPPPLQQGAPRTGAVSVQFSF